MLFPSFLLLLSFLLLYVSGCFVNVCYFCYFRRNHSSCVLIETLQSNEALRALHREDRSVRWTCYLFSLDVKLDIKIFIRRAESFQFSHQTNSIQNEIHLFFKGYMMVNLVHFSLGSTAIIVYFFILYSEA